jgi:hypothetical protein
VEMRLATGQDQYAARRMCGQLALVAEVVDTVLEHQNFGNRNNWTMVLIVCRMAADSMVLMHRICLHGAIGATASSQSFD